MFRTGCRLRRLTRRYGLAPASDLVTVSAGATLVALAIGVLVILLMK